ncbi:major facilitator superfamily MFS_1 [Solidesulfovibrio carbinoliphilus subsp. oakridgensis]|uniref:Major facilitator superfamily MFS_1 n=1 Tax=Solidesulfovibrio carbinoliphilus subsp. oakridgensis TaxID=694327 RepID=G7Q6U1_9BACT|nr:MFS transporter [Solidesulfovibrio carbinoliphilus]EHJ48026.1 major facilitator superfamily MFS_1 [Solidesulfovibrio carbinoliphilus subsp. oakridgensis]
MKHCDNPDRPEYALTRTALRASGRADILLFLLVSTIASTAGLQAWQTLINNFAVEAAHLGADQIGFVQSIREVPGFLSMLVVYVLLVFSEQRAASLAVLLLGLGLCLTGYFPSFWGLTLTTLVMSTGFHYYEPLNQSLTLQHFNTFEAPVVLSRIRAVGALANIAVGVVIYFLADAMGYTGMFAATGAVVAAVGVWGLFKKPCETNVPPQKKKMYLRRKYWLYYLLTFLEGSRRQIFIVFAVYLLVKKFDYSIQSITILFVINNAINYFLNPMIGRAINHFGERQLLSIEYGGMILVFLTYAYTDSHITAGIMYVLDFLIFNFSVGVRTYYQKIAAPEDVASGMAMGFTINHIAAVVVPVLGGVLWMVDYKIPFFIGVGLGVVSLAFTQLIRTPEKAPA